MRDLCSLGRIRPRLRAKRAIKRDCIESDAVGPRCSRTRRVAPRGQTRRPPLHFAVLSQEPFDKPRVELPRSKIGIRQNLPMQRNRRIHAFDDKHLQRPCHTRAGLVPILGTHNQLRDQRIVIRWNHSLGVGRGIHAYAGSSRRMKRGNLPGRRRELLGVLRVDAALDRVTAVHDWPVQHILHLRASRNHDLALHQVDIGNHLRHRMLHLNAGVHLNKVELAVLIHQELNRSRVPISDRRQRLAQHIPDLLPQFRSHLGRRGLFQQLLEESPSTQVTPELRKEVGDVLCKSLAAIGYWNAGTIEFLMDQDRKLHFIEMNTRIQVEHPVTEMVTDVDLVKSQIMIAAGAKMEDVLHGPIVHRGHSIECRINAEHPEKFTPSAGKITAFHPPGGTGVRVDTAAYAEGVIPPYYDSLIAKLIVRAKDRNEAISRMARALEMFMVEGVYTTIPLHRKILADPDFRAGKFDTGFIERFLAKNGKM